MAKIIKAGYVSDVKTYVNGLISTDAETIEDAVKITALYVDGLKKGWHVDSIRTNDNGDIVIDIKKVE